MGELPSFQEFFGAVAGFGAVVGLNALNRRPLYTSLYKHFIGAGIGFMAGRAVNYDTERRAREKRIYIEDYMRLHPEDFVESPPKYYRDVFEKWMPVR